LLTSATAVMQICRPSEIAGIAYLGKLSSSSGG
jgi:hypothetical protein